MRKELREGELTLKDMSALREGASVRDQWKKTGAVIKDYTLQHVVKMGWGGQFEEERRDLRPFELRLDDDRYVISWGELKDAEAEGFFRRETPDTRYTLRWLEGKHITIDTELNEEAARDMIFRLTTDKHEVLLDWYEVLRAGRFI